MRFFGYLGQQAPLVFVVLTLALLYATGSIHFGAAPPADVDQVATDPHAGHDHGAEPATEPDDPHAGHDHAAHEAEDDLHAGHDHAAHEAEDDPHAGHDHAAHEAEDDPHAGHDHAAHEAEDDPHAGHDHAAHEAEDDPHAGHDHAAHEAEDDPHAGHDHAAHEAEDDPHAGHDHAAHEAEDDPHAGHDHADEPAEDIDDLLVPADDGEADCAEDGCGAGVTGSLDALAKRRCEHGIAIDCDDCRFEIGVVKVEPDVAGTLLRLAKVSTRNAAREIGLTGQVQFDRTRTVEVPAPVGGRVLSLAVDLGHDVKVGDLLAILHSGQIGEARASYLSARTAEEIATKEQERQAGVAKALRSLLAGMDDCVAPSAGDDHLEEADHKHGETEDTEGYVGEWKSKLLGAAARLRLARVRHERELELEKKGISASAEHEVAHQEYEAAKADYCALVEEVKLSLTVETLKADNARKEAAGRLLAAGQRLQVYGLAQKDIAALARDGAGSDFARLEIRAPRTGTITSLDVSAGRYVEESDHLFTIADLGHLWVWCDLYERDLGAIATAISHGKTVTARLSVASFPGESFVGILDYLGSELDPHTRTLPARIQVANPDDRLRAGMFADVFVAIPKSGTVRVVPREAVLSDEGVSFLFQYWKDDFWVRRDIVVRGNFGDLVAFEGDVPVGATVAAGGAFMLKSDVLREKMGAG